MQKVQEKNIYLKMFKIVAESNPVRQLDTVHCRVPKPGMQFMKGKIN